jgi:pentatricopeptide repeat protein
MLIPISHEDQRGRRWPYVTLVTIVLNIGIFILTTGAIERQNAEYAARTREALQYYLKYPYLTPAQPLDRLMDQLMRAGRQGQMLQAYRESARAESERGAGVDPVIKEARQEALNALCRAMSLAESASPLKKYAYVPVDNNLLGLLTYQFLHGGWLHLLGNMLFLYLAGCNVEDRWGRVLFPLFYLSAGAVAALTQKLAAPQSISPLIGASGAIAGVMGAFLIKFARTRIKFLLILFFRPRFFSAPAYLMLPLWLGLQLFFGLMTSGLGAEGGVAFWAHAGGFVYGVLFAVALGLSGLDARIDQSIESEVSIKQAPEIVQAGEMINAGQAAQAVAMLEEFARRQPRSTEAQLELLRAAKALNDEPREQRAYIRLVGLYVQQNEMDTALALYEEMHTREMEIEVPAALRLRLARHLERNNFLEGAGQEYLNIYSNSLPDSTSFQALLAHANLLLRTGRKPEALQLFLVARDSPVPHLEYEATISHGIKQAQAG